MSSDTEHAHPEGSPELELAWAKLEEGLAEEALELLAESRASGRHVPESLAWTALGEVERAQAALDLAERDPASDVDELSWARGELALTEWRLDDARAAFESIADGETSPVVLDRLSLLDDLEGRTEDAQRRLEQAHALDPERVPLPPRLEGDEFQAVVEDALGGLPETFVDALQRIAVVIDSVPSIELAQAAPLDTPPDLLGLFTGRSLLDGEPADAIEAPPVVYLFQRNLERSCVDRDELLEQIRITLLHELGHALGFDEDEVDAMGLG